MTSQSSPGPRSEQAPGPSEPRICKRPGCGAPVPAPRGGRGRRRQFCSNECARKYHNDARVPAPRTAPPEDTTRAGRSMFRTGIERRLAERGLLLPAPLEPALSLPRVRLRPRRAFVSGHGPVMPDGTLWPLRGKVGADLTEEQAYAAARAAGLAMLSSLREALGDLDRVTGWLRVFGMVNAAAGLPGTPAVIDGFSDLILDLWGPMAGAHARSAVGVAALPFDVPVQIEAEVAVD